MDQLAEVYFSLKLVEPGSDCSIPEHMESSFDALRKLQDQCLESLNEILKRVGCKFIFFERYNSKKFNSNQISP